LTVLHDRHFKKIGGHVERIFKIYDLDKILRSRTYPIAASALSEELGISTSTLKRFMRTLEGLGAPIEASRSGYCYDKSQRFELPGVWFTEGELLGLKTAHDLLGTAAPSLLSETLGPIRKKLDELLAGGKTGSGAIAKRVRIVKHAGRGTGTCFDQVVERKQLQFDFHARTSGEDQQRKVSPQQITHYRDNWYLDAWCNDRRALRSFALERVRNARVSKLRAKQISPQEMGTHFSNSYGIFAGKPTATARLVFNARRARSGLAKKCGTRHLSTRHPVFESS
jgi:predicted DNA-binding transcriptional regulator YafY